MNPFFRLFIFLAIAFLFSSISAIAQVPTLDPAQTVDIATGRMGFSLPLGTVQGVNGHDFPINLNYQSGIMTAQPASQVGLGFEYGAGSITRKVVELPDDNTGGDKYIYIQTKPYCATTFLEWIKNIVVRAIHSSWHFIIPGIQAFESLSQIYSANVGLLRNNMDQRSKAGPEFFLAGGGKDPAYNYNDWDKKGFFKGGEGKDYPDIYFVNTPFLSGTMVWLGDKKTGHFAFQQAGSNFTAATSTVQVEYFCDIGVEKFKITTPDGTRLIFDKVDKMPYHYKSDWNQSEANEQWCRPYCERWCQVFTSHKQLEAIPMKWHLTRVLFSDYIDGNGDEDPFSGATNKGSWISFDYSDDVVAKRMYRPDKAYGVARQDGPYSRVNSWVDQMSGSNFGAVDGEMDGVTFYDLVGISTPNQSAVFEYTSDRRDNLWYSQGTETPVFQNVLRSIKLKSQDLSVIKTIDFVTAYELRPGSENAVAFPDHQPTDNTSGASLTLKQINITGNNGTPLPPVVFEYGFNPNALDFNFVNSNNLYDMAAQRKDVYGYYNPNASNDCNMWGDRTKTVQSGQVQAAAWSLKKVRFPNDMTIEWNYESNEYDMANGVSVGGPGGGPRYTGGIRVNQLKVYDGIHQIPYTLSYFYTAASGDFNEQTGGCSGYASCEPFYYATLLMDYRTGHPRTFGGLYTSAQVAYEKVQVVKNYQASSPNAPFGYTVYEFTHAGDPAVNGYHPNGGTYGDVDSSWMRGFLINQSIFNANRTLVSKEAREIAFTEQCMPKVESTSYILDIRDPSSGNAYETNKYTVGWPRISKIQTTNLGVKSEKAFSYAPDVPAPTPDLVSKTINICNVLDPWGGTCQADVMTDGYNQTSCFARTLKFETQTKLDYITATPLSINGNYYATLKIGVDLPQQTPADGWDNSWSKTLTFNSIPLQQNQCTILGAGAVDVNDNPDLLLVTGNISNLGVGIGFFPDIHITNHIISWGTPVWKTFSLGNITYNGDIIVSAAIEDMSTYPTIFFLEGENQNNGNPDVHRRIFAFLDYGITNQYPIICVSSTFHSLKGDKIAVVDYDKDGLHDDLEITGGGNKLIPDEINRPIHRTVLHNVSYNTTTHEITFDPSQPVIDLPDYFCLGPKRYAGDNSITPETDYRYLGMSEGETSNNYEKKIFAVVRPNYYAYFDNLGNTFPCLSLIAYIPSQTFSGDIDGQPNLITETNSDGTVRVTKLTPAYFKYPVMGPDYYKHMLTQTCQTTVYKNSVTATNAVSSQATTYSIYDSWTAIGTAKRKVYYNFPANGDINTLDSRTPDLVENLRSLDCPVNTGKFDYATLIEDEITAPVSGMYEILLVSDDEANVNIYSGPLSDPASSRVFTLFSTGTWAHNDWTAPNVPAELITLEAGKKYGIRVFHHQRTGGDNLSVGWKLPGGEAAPVVPIPASVLSNSHTDVVWRPNSTYAWKTNLTSAGLPVSPLMDFDFTPGVSNNSSWVPTSGQIKYNSFGQVIEAVNAAGKPSASLYGTTASLPVASIANATFNESGVFTCDYDIYENGYFDKQNMWRHHDETTLLPGAVCAVESTYPHFGEKSLHVKNCKAVVRTIAIYSSTDHITRSAWVRPVNTNPIRFAACLVVNGVGYNAINYDYIYNEAKGLKANGKWQLVQFTIDISKPNGLPALPTGIDGNNDGLYVWIGNHPQPTDAVADFYIDDIRIAPAKSLVSTTYYDSKWQQPLLTVDANNNPGQKVEYDNFGRPVGWYKIDKTNPAVKTPVQSKTYHLMSD